MDQMAEVNEKLAALDRGEVVDLALTSPSGLLRSSKEIWKASEDRYILCHLIDGSETTFSKQGIIECFLGTRSVWESDLS